MSKDNVIVVYLTNLIDSRGATIGQAGVIRDVDGKETILPVSFSNSKDLSEKERFLRVINGSFGSGKNYMFYAKFCEIITSYGGHEPMVFVADELVTKKEYSLQ